MLSAAGECELSTKTFVKNTWKKFKELLSVLSSHHLSFKTCGRMYSSCVQSAMLHASETWPLTQPDLQHLKRNDRAMIRQICNVKPQDNCHHQIQWATCAAWHWASGPHSEGEKALLVWICGTLQWCSQDNLCLQVYEKRGPGRPKMTWKQLTEKDCKSGSSQLSTLMIDIPGDLVWDLPYVQKGDPLIWMLPLYLHVNQTSIDDDDELSFLVKECTQVLVNHLED